MLRADYLLSLFCALGTLFRNVETTPIVILPPDNNNGGPAELMSTEMATLATTAKNVTPVTPVAVEEIGSESSNISSGKDIGEGTVVAVKLGENETLSTSVSPISSSSTEQNTFDTTATSGVTQPVTRGFNEDQINSTKEEEPTTPELIIKTTGTTSSGTTPTTTTGGGSGTTSEITTDDVTQQTVTSQSLTLKGATESNPKEETTTHNLEEESTQTTVHTPVRIGVSSIQDSNETGGNYKDKAPAVYHPYLEEILKQDDIVHTNNDTATSPAPIRIKSVGHPSSQNAIIKNYPYGPLPNFGEKEMDKLRLNHWRVQQILKGHDHNSHSHPPRLAGQLGTGKAGKASSHPVVVMLGQKRASSSSPSAATAKLSSLDQDEFHTSVLASEVDAAIAEQQQDDDSQTSPTTPSKLRTFFNWISNPLKRKPNEEDERLKQAKAQQPILPFALGYRGDFLFW